MVEINHHSTDEDIIAAFYATGDTELLGHIYTRYHGRMESWSRWHFWMKPEAFREMYADFWLHIQPRLQRKMFHPARGIAFSTWYYHAWKRFVWGELRKKRLELAEAEPDPEHIRSTACNPEELLLQSERLALVQSIARSACAMPVDEELLTELQQEQTTDHMVATTGLKSETVRSRLHRFRTRARQILAVHPLRHVITH